MPKNWIWYAVGAAVIYYLYTQNQSGGFTIGPIGPQGSGTPSSSGQSGG
jgi:hypothetical protein